MNFKQSYNMKKLFISAVALVALLLGSNTQTNAQERLPEYLQAEKFTQAKLNTMLFSTGIDPHWFQKGNNFWYTYKTNEGVFWYVVTPSAGKQELLFDREEMASQLSQIVQDPFIAENLPIRELKAKEDGKTFTFEVKASTDSTFHFTYDYTTKELIHVKDKEKELKRLSWGSVSPDKKYVVYAKDLNLYKMSYEDYQKARKDEKDTTIVEIQLTTDGVEHFGYGMPHNRLNTDSLLNGKRRSAYGLWSPDSKHFVTILTDNRAVKDLWVINVMSKPRPTLESYKYQMPGEKESPVEHLILFDMENNTKKEIDTYAFKDQTLEFQRRTPLKKERDMEFRPSIWVGDNNTFYINRSSRDLYRIDICAYTIGQDTLVPIIKERMNTYQETRGLKVINNGTELIQWSERDGWAHLYLYDNQGNLKNRITKGAWHVEDIVSVDEKARVVYFKANGMNENENPYYEHLYRINLDGKGLKQITQGDYFHDTEVDDDARFIVDNYSRVNTIPRTSLLDKNGKEVMLLQEADFSQLFAAGYKFPEPFVVKAADGVTDLYGVMYKPFNFDSTALYPIIDYVYPGPQVEATTYPFTRMSPRTDRLAQAGFIVITVGQRGGHPSRSKWYHNFGYGNMRDYPLADHKYAIEQLANRHAFIDIDRVGIHGHSGGGFMSTAAMCQYPDFFKAAVSCAGNHDNNIYNRWWSETHHGVKEKVVKGDTTFVYKISTNPQIAANLKGHLLLVHGDIDNNVHPGNTMRVVDALIRAGKRFDMLILPQQRHGFGNMNEYFYWRMVDFFSEHLKGQSEKSVNIPRR